MLYLFDMDGTLISGYMDNPDKDFHTWEGLPNRSETIAMLHARGHEIGIVTNQAGVAFGFVSEQDVVQKLRLLASYIGYPSIWIHHGGAPVRSGDDEPSLRCHVCFSDARSSNAQYTDPRDTMRRKPSGIMIREAIIYQQAAASVGVLFIGDRPEDEAAAKDAGVPFQWADAFFEES